MKGVADRTLELMNEFQKVQFTKSYRDFQHFLVVKIEELEDELGDYKKHFEPQMIQLRLHSDAVAQQRKTYKVRGVDDETE